MTVIKTFLDNMKILFHENNRDFTKQKLVGTVALFCTFATLFDAWINRRLYKYVWLSNHICF